MKLRKPSYRHSNSYFKIHTNTGCFTTLGHNCRRWFPRSLWWKNSYKHVSDFGRLRSYGRFLIPVHALVWTAITAGGSYSASLVAAVISTLGRWGGLVFAWRFTTERQAVLRPAKAFSKISFKHRKIQIKGNFTKLTLHLYFKCIMYYAGLLFCSVYCQ